MKHKSLVNQVCSYELFQVSFLKFQIKERKKMITEHYERLQEERYIKNVKV